MNSVREDRAPVKDDEQEMYRRPDPLPVRLPDITTVPAPWRGAIHVLRSLLGSGDDNPKLAKSNRSGAGYRTWGLSLAPAMESGFNLCSSSTPGCRAACLYRQGHGRLFPTIAAARIARAVAFKEHRDWFERSLVYELGRITRKADAEGYRVAVRLNVVSDVMWEREFPALFWLFRDVQFYDYTKHAKRMFRFLADELPLNYSLTYSMNENDTHARTVLAAGGTVAIVFRGRLPKAWCGFPVVDGDQNDLRFLDPTGVVVGLSAKGSAKSDTTGFVVDSLGAPARRMALEVC
jgi:Gene product 88